VPVYSYNCRYIGRHDNLQWAYIAFPSYNDAVMRKLYGIFMNKYLKIVLQQTLKSRLYGKCWHKRFT